MKVQDIISENFDNCNIKDKVFIMDMKARAEDSAKNIVRNFLNDYRYALNGGRYDYQSKEEHGVSDEAINKVKIIMPQIMIQGLIKSIHEIKETIGFLEDEKEEEEKPEVKVVQATIEKPMMEPVSSNYFNY